MISISLCMIVKDEEKTIGRCLESVKDLMDEIVVVDTGSTDHTKEIACRYTNRVIDFQWIDDFAAARNASFSQATKDYIMWLDADDVLLEESQRKLADLKKSLDPSVDSVSMKYHLAIDEYGNVTVSGRRNRLVKRNHHFQWYGAVHEYLLVSGHILNSDIAITHKRVRHDSGRNITIYEKRLAKGEEFTPRDLYYYANELRDHCRYEEAIKYYQIFLATKKGWLEDEISACAKLADCYYQMGDREKEREFIFKSFEYDTPHGELCCRLGFQFLQKNQLKKAIFWYKLATELDRPEKSWGFINHACWTWLPHLQLCVCYYRLGDYELAHRHNEIARKYRSKDERILFNKRLIEMQLKK